MNKVLVIIAAVLLCAAGCRQSETAMNKDFLQLATERYSVRKFDTTRVDQTVIDKILRAGQVAPTAINSQPQKIYVVKSEDVMAKMREASPCMYGAPHCFVYCYDDTRAVPRGEGTYGDIDVSIVMTHMLLEATELGVGTCIVGGYNPEKVREALELPENIHPLLLMPFGYAASDCEPSKYHSDYRPLEETVEYR